MKTCRDDYDLGLRCAVHNHCVTCGGYIGPTPPSEGMFYTHTDCGLPIQPVDDPMGQDRFRWERELRGDA